MLDANQSLSDCYKGDSLRPYSIEWLCLQHGMDDPFIKLFSSRPNSTTITPNRDIDYILTSGIDISNISTLHQNLPCCSDHLGILFDIDLEKFFSSSYSDIYSISPRSLTSGNLRSVTSYLKYVSEQVSIHKLEEKVYPLAEKAHSNPSGFTLLDAECLNKLDAHLTDIMLTGERLCSNRRNQRQWWSPTQREIGRTYSYWKQKSNMENKKLIQWEHLSRLRKYTSISDEDHITLDPVQIQSRKREARNKWRSCKKKSQVIRRQFLTERAEYLAAKMRTTEEKALKAILHAEEARKIYSNIKGISGKQQVPLTQVDILSDPGNKLSAHTTLTSKDDIEENIL
jgi:hypothetical protein